MKALWTGATACAACLLAGTLWADPVPIAGYDIGDAVLSGHGGWAHTYSGTIVSGASFTHNTWAGTQATYSGVGSGTMNDDVIGTSLATSQLFVARPGATDSTLLDPFIGLTFSFPYTIDTLEIYGGDVPDNAVPGAITSVRIGLLEADTFVFHEETFVTTPFGDTSNFGRQYNDRVSLIGSSLEGIPAISLAIFEVDVESGVGGWFSITELKVEGTFVPEPGAAGLVGLVALAAGRRARRRD